MRAAEFATRLAQVRRHAEHYSACCPAHQDRTPSLSFRDGREGLVVHCWAGCSVDAITRAAGIAVPELFYAPGERPGRERRAPLNRPLTPAQEWRRVWTDTLRDADAAGRFLSVWEPIFSRCDFVRHATRHADGYRARASGMSPDDPAMWDEAALAVLFDDEARLVEMEADELAAAARRVAG